MIADGVYFRMPEEEYLAEERLSKSGIKRLRISPADYWAESYLNPNPRILTPEQEEKLAMARLIGRAYHCARLEPDRYGETYVRRPHPRDYAGEEGFLATGAAIERELAARTDADGKALPKKSKDDEHGVLSQAWRLRAAGYEGPIWHIIEAVWKDNLLPGQIALPGQAFDEIAVDMERIRAVPAVHDLLSGGQPEVSVFWHCPETGIPMKARFDYLRPDGWVEFKTFANAGGKSLYQALTDAVRYNRYHIDAVAYLQAMEAIRTDPWASQVEDSTADEVALVAAIMAATEPPECHLVFQQKGGVPNILERRFRFYQDTGSEAAIAELERMGLTDNAEKARRFQEIAGAQRHRTAIHEKARREIRAAKELFLAYSEIYARGEPWLPFNPSGEISDLDFSSYWLEEAV